MQPEVSRAALYVALGVVAGVAVIGFLRGSHPDDYDFVTPVRHVESEATAGLHTAPTYSMLRDQSRGEASFPTDLAALAAAVPASVDAPAPFGSTRDAVRTRAERRAFDGAPPVIPHPVNQAAVSECVACHEDGIRIGDRRAPPYPHERFAVCTQCHAMAAPALPWEGEVSPDPRDVPNAFAGLEAPVGGPRWTGVSPPAMPHDSHMRERCDSCHGPNGSDPIRSSHSYRQSCQQCHVQDAQLEQRSGGRP